ncbi:MAG: hypothetical protein ACLFTK_15555, partial [Anaerolineales bacterium]
VGRAFTDHNLTVPELDNIRIEPRVEQGDQVILTLQGRAPERFGCYFGTWQLRIPDYSLFVGEPFIISYRVFGGR